MKGPLFQQVKVLPRQRSSQPGSFPSSRGGNEAAEAWEKGGSFGLSASWQAVTRVNTEAAPKDTMRRPTLPGLGEGWYGPDNQWTARPARFAGVVGDSMPTRSNGQHGKPVWVATAANRCVRRLAGAGGGGARSTAEAG